MVASAQQPLHHQGCAHGIEQAKVFWNPALLFGRERGRERGGEVRGVDGMAGEWGVSGAGPGGGSAHQGVEVIAQQGPVVVDLALQDDQQEE